MGILIGCEGISLEYPTRKVLKDVTLGVAEGDRIGIVGKNGDGKTTLLRLVSGYLEPDEGRVTMRRGISVGLLGQSDTLDDGATVGECVVGDVPVHEWAGDARIRDIITALIGDVPWNAKVGSLSGGQRRRVDLTRLLIGTWDVLALDEPTNHLDMRAINWLAEHLKRRWAKGEGAFMIVTHDRWFLDEVCLNMWEVHDRTVDPFEGGYSAYIQQRLERDRQARIIEERRQNILRKELAWLARGPQARGTKPKFRVEEAKAMIADVPPVRNEIELHRLAVSRLGKQVVEMKNVSVKLGQKTILNKVDWIVGPGDRFGILGANGVGKTTLLNVIGGFMQPDSGTVKIGKTVKIAVLSQRLDELNKHRGEMVREVLSEVKRRYVIDGKEYTSNQLLEQLGFEPGQLLTRVEELSGGQQRRLQLLLVLLSEPNVLILDEPGNDMDTDMLALLEDMLDSWPGTLFLVSHDRYMMEHVTDHQFVLMDGKVTHAPGGVDEFLRRLEAHDRGVTPIVFESLNAARDLGDGGVGADGAPAGGDGAGTGGLVDGVAGAGGAAGATGVPAVPAAPAAPKMSRSDEYKLRKQLESVERKLQTQHKKAAELEKQMLEVDASDFVRLGQMQQQLEEMREAAEELELEWLELSEQLG